MPVYVDEIRSYGTKGDWCHMCVEAGGDLNELHKFAASVGLRHSWVQAHPLHPHYDLRPSKRTLAVQRGAVELSNQEFVKRCSRFFDRP